jgi:hypothetical protein
MPGKMAISAPRPPFGLPDALVVLVASRLVLQEGRKYVNIHARSGVSGESRFTSDVTLPSPAIEGRSLARAQGLPAWCA